jgi:hypothetical protein
MSSDPAAPAAAAGAGATPAQGTIPPLPLGSGKAASSALISKAGRTTKDVTGELDAFELHKQKV